MFYYLFHTLASVYSFLHVFQYITFRTVLAAITALLICLVLGPRLIQRLTGSQIGEKIRTDGPEQHHHKAGTPTMGGLLIVVGTLTPTILWADIVNRYILVLIFTMISFALVGFIDDYLKIRWQGEGKKGLAGWSKFRWQIILSLIIGCVLLYYHPDPDATHLLVPFFKNVFPDFGFFYLFLIVAVIVGSSNAVNLTDGLDGLAIGNVIIVTGSFLILTYLVGHAYLSRYLLIPHIRDAGEITIFCGALIGSGLGFLWFNAYPARVFLGDVGALSLGAVIGILAICTKQELLLLILGGIFVSEAVSVIIQVGSYKLTGQRVFLMTPLHHHFELKGWHEVTITIRFLIVALLLNLIGLGTLKLR